MPNFNLLKKIFCSIILLTIFSLDFAYFEPAKSTSEFLQNQTYKSNFSQTTKAYAQKSLATTQSSTQITTPSTSSSTTPSTTDSTTPSTTQTGSDSCYDNLYDAKPRYAKNDEESLNCLTYTIIAPDSAVNNTIIPVTLLGSSMEYIDKISVFISDPVTTNYFEKGEIGNSGEYYSMFTYNWDTKEAKTNTDSANSTHTIEADLYHGDKLLMAVTKDIKIIDYKNSTAAQHDNGTSEFKDHPFFGAILGVRSLDNYWLNKISCDSSCDSGEAIMNKTLAAIQDEKFTFDDWADLYNFFTVKGYAYMDKINASSNEEAVKLYADYLISTEILGRIQEALQSAAGVESDPALDDSISNSPILKGVMMALEKYKFELSRIDLSEIKDADTFKAKYPDLYTKFGEEASKYFTMDQVNEYLKEQQEIQSEESSEDSSNESSTDTTALFSAQKAYALDPISLGVAGAFQLWDTIMVATGRISGKDYAIRTAANGITLLAPAGISAVARFGGKAATSIVERVGIKAGFAAVRGIAEKFGIKALAETATKQSMNALDKMIAAKAAGSSLTKAITEKLTATGLGKFMSKIIKFPAAIVKTVAMFLFARALLSNFQCVYDASKTANGDVIKAGINYVFCVIGHIFIDFGTSIINWALGFLKKAAQVSYNSNAPNIVFGGVEKAYAQSRTSASSTAASLSQAIRSKEIKNTWTFALSFVDILIVFSIIVVAFSQILNLQIDTYTLKKTLPNLIIGIIGANLSYFLILGLVDLASVLTVEVLKPFGGIDAMSTSIASIMGFDPAMVGKGAVAIGLFALAFTNPATAILATLLVMILFLIPAILIFFDGILLYWRMYMIFILTAVSPLAILSMGVPSMSQYFKMWWKNILNWIFIAPIMLFLLSLATAYKDNVIAKSGISTAISGQTFNMSWFGGWVLGLILLWLAFMIPIKMLGGPVGQMLWAFGSKTGRQTFKNVLGGTKHQLNKSRFHTDADYKKNLGRINELKALNEAGNLDAAGQMEMNSLIWQNKGLGLRRGLLTGIYAPGDWLAGQAEQKKHYEGRSAYLSATSGAFSAGAGPRAGNRAIGSAERKETEGISEAALRAMMDREAYGRRVSQAILADIEEAQKNGTASTFDDAEWQSVVNAIQNKQYEEAGKLFDEKVSDKNRSSIVKTGSMATSNWILKNAMGSPDKMVESKDSYDIAMDRNDAIKIGVYMQEILSRRRSSRRSGQDVMGDIGNANPYSYEGSGFIDHNAGIEEGHNVATASVKTAKPRDYFDPSIDSQSMNELEQEIILTAVPDKESIDKAAQDIASRIQVKTQQGTIIPADKIKIQTQSALAAINESEKNAFNKKIQDAFGIMPDIEEKIKVNPSLDVDNLEKQVGDLDIKINTAPQLNKADIAQELQKIANQVGAESATVAAAKFKSDDPEAVRQIAQKMIRQYKYALASAKGKIQNEPSIEVGGIKMTAKVASDIAFDFKAQDITESLKRHEFELSHQATEIAQNEVKSLSEAIGKISTGNIGSSQATQKIFDDLAHNIVETARTQGKQMGSAAVQVATTEFATALAQGYNKGLTESIVRQDLENIIEKHSVTPKPVQQVYGNE